MIVGLNPEPRRCGFASCKFHLFFEHCSDKSSHEWSCSLDLNAVKSDVSAAADLKVFEESRGNFVRSLSEPGTSWKTESSSRWPLTSMGSIMFKSHINECNI